MSFVEQLEAWKTERLAPIIGAGRMSLTDDAAGNATQLLQVALANEINVSELAAAWMPGTRELDVKLAFARQAGDEAGHFQLVADRLTALGFDASAFVPADSPLFQYLRGLTTTVERIAAGLVTLESIAYGVNENFMAYCERRGDAETVRIYRDYIQPDEQAHQRLGQRLLAKYATSPEQQQAARDTVARVLEIAGATRASAAARLGTACFPGC
ncbi:MAG TPA: ferritin-like domain-containing protein [Kofleriaceae bacterium]|nr:ferritin-like domain-containing protein [Kofleriaceae bacterium]